MFSLETWYLRDKGTRLDRQSRSPQDRHIRTVAG